jgi:hypothetical protein
MILREYILKGGRSSGGTLILNSISGDLGEISTLVVGKQGNE